MGGYDMIVKKLINDEYIDETVNDNELVPDDKLITPDEALQAFAKNLANPDTNSIAKIRAAAQQLLNDTQGVAK